jgi:hypothetical protein
VTLLDAAPELVASGAAGAHAARVERSGHRVSAMAARVTVGIEDDAVDRVASLGGGGSRVGEKPRANQPTGA